MEQANTSFKTLPARYYTDPELFRLDLEEFYFGSWICAGRADVIPTPGDYFLREIGGESFIVVRDPKNTVKAFYNVCRHRGTRMCTSAEGNFGARIQCPYHGWTYALDGRLLGAPHMDGVDFNREDYPLHETHAALWDGHIFLHMGKQPAPLASQLID